MHKSITLLLSSDNIGSLCLIGELQAHLYHLYCYATLHEEVVMKKHLNIQYL